MMKDEGIDYELVNRIRQAVAEKSNYQPGRLVIKLAALYVEFDLKALELEVVNVFNETVTEEDRDYIKKNSIYIDKRNTYCLNDYNKKLVIQKTGLDENRALVSRMKLYEGTVAQSLVRDFILGTAPPVELLSPAQLIAAYDIIKLLKDSGFTDLPDEAEIFKLVRKEELQIPLKKITANFKGRSEQLSMLSDFIEAPSAAEKPRWFSSISRNETSPIKIGMMVSGIGGVGKSTLVSKYILNRLEEGQGNKMPFVYVDFDKPGFSISSIFSLVKEALRQLAIQAPRYERFFKEATDTIEFDYRQEFEMVSSRSSDRQYIYEQLITREVSSLLQTITFPIVIVFDSFEELQYRAKTHEIENLFKLIKEVIDHVPWLKVIFVGRSEIKYNGYSFEPIRLLSFDVVSAAGFLESMHIKDAALQQAIYRQFGGNPLTLQLAASLILKELKEDEINFENVESKQLFASIDEGLIQQQLVTRNLKHIHNEAVRKFAVPGILVRSIDADIIQQVLAEPCGLGHVGPEEASVLFEDLKKETFLLNFDGSHISFRTDLRIELYNFIMNDTSYNGKAVHDSAVEYYRNKTEPENQAEYLYHCLKRGDNQEIIDQVYQPEMRRYLENSLVELPAPAYVHLARIMGIGSSEEKLNEVSQAEWEAFQVKQAKLVLEDGDEVQLVQLLQEFSGRKLVSQNSLFKYYEAAIYLRLNNLSRAEGIITTEIKRNPNESTGSLKFYLLLSSVHEYRLNFESAYNILLDADRLLQPGLDKGDSAEYYHSLLQYYFAITRLQRRLELYSDFRLKKNIPAVLEQLDLTDIQDKDSIFVYLPKPYNFALQKLYAAERSSTNAITTSRLTRPDDIKQKKKDEVSFLLDFFAFSNNRFLNSKSFSKVFKGEAKTNILTETDLERYLRRNYDAHLKDIALPGSFEVNLADFILYIELLPRQGNDIVIEKISTVKDLLRKTKVVANDFISLANVKTCIEKLHEAFPPGGDQPLVVSDVLDEQGNQYVNLIQRGSGVYGFSLLGYTYILEQMGIRFLRMAGTGTGALNTALLAITGKKEDTKSEDLLETFLGLNFFNLVDGPPLMRYLIKNFITRENFLTFLSKRAALFGLSACLIVILNIVLQNFQYVSTTLFYVSNILLVTTILYFAFVAGIFLYTLKMLLFPKKGSFGANPGNYLYDWIKNQFLKKNIRTVSELKAKAVELPVLHARQAGIMGIELLKAEVKFITSELVTENKISFPEMCNLFREEKNIDTLQPAGFVQAAMAVPFFFQSYFIENIPYEEDEIKKAWQNHFGEEPPVKANFVDGGIFSNFPINIFYEAAVITPLLPTFGIDTGDIRAYAGIRGNETLNWVSYLLRIYNISRKNIEKDFVLKNKNLKRGIGVIPLYDYNLLNFFLSNQEKAELFYQGAKAATDFLLNFDWEAYKTNKIKN